MVYVKNTKIVTWNILFLASKFVFLHTRHDTSIYSETILWAYVAREDVHADFLFQFFNILKFVKYVFQNKESIYFHEPKKFVKYVFHNKKSICFQEPKQYSWYYVVMKLGVLISTWFLYLALYKILKPWIYH
jgi:hypothetical protein